MVQCAGRSRVTKEPCKNQAEGDTKYCRFHGSRNRRGKDHEWYKHGRYATAAPARLQDDLIALAEDEALVELNDELALLKARALDLLKRVDHGESGKLWSELRKVAAKLRAAVNDDDWPAITAYATEIIRVAEEGVADWTTWNELQTTIRDVTRVAESQRRHRIEEQQMISLDAAYALMASLVDVVRGTVQDERVIDRVVAEFERAVSAQSYKQAPTPASSYPA